MESQSCSRKRPGLQLSERVSLLVTQWSGTLQLFPPRQEQPGASSSHFPTCLQGYKQPLSLPLGSRLFCDGNWSFSPRFCITSTAHRLLTPVSQGNAGKTALLGEIPSLVIKISSLKKKNIPPTHFAWRQKSPSYFSKSYPFLPRKNTKSAKWL